MAIGISRAGADKGFTGEAFEVQWREALQANLMDVTAEQKRIMEKVFWAGKLAIDVNPHRLEVTGVTWKHLLPAKGEREMGQPLNARTGIIVKQPVYRYLEPIRLIPPCMGCHGQPKGHPDMLGFEVGDVIGLMSVTLAVS